MDRTEVIQYLRENFNKVFHVEISLVESQERHGVFLKPVLKICDAVSGEVLDLGISDADFECKCLWCAG